MRGTKRMPAQGPLSTRSIRVLNERVQSIDAKAVTVKIYVVRTLTTQNDRYAGDAVWSGPQSDMRHWFG